MGQGGSKKKGSIGAQLREQAKLIKRVQEYLKKLDKLFAEWEKTHRGISRATDSFFSAGTPYRDNAVAIMQHLKIFEKARADLRPQIVAVGQTAKELLKKAKSIEKLVEDRDQLSRKVTAHNKKLNRLKTRNSERPDAKTQQDILKAEEKLNAMTNQFKIKEMQAQFETNNAMNTKYLDAATLVHRSVLIAVTFLRVTTPEMLKAEGYLGVVQPKDTGVHPLGRSGSGQPVMFQLGGNPSISPDPIQSEMRPVSPSNGFGPIMPTAPNSPTHMGSSIRHGNEWGPSESPVAQQEGARGLNGVANGHSSSTTSPHDEVMGHSMDSTSCNEVFQHGILTQKYKEGMVQIAELRNPFDPEI
ncbi:hypothetical protein TGPRC2_320760 [Toxoplasma gondii TgCatPRC2]|uniref:Uncharacterized protein n=14 Tax=Toxoplasma gondii TaxID=5811 RepID=A0A125YNE2_TOXGV|nr:hypothetical protein TGME49_320760 [Toxoplasma gondii ME49]EPR58076.1 hypothetical protein TGGT1_320760 [Toxoplasma gondii GT1]ESS29861.1 hypothetical protein TGVEG_320760 [Toxoplasma gondii VEG]KAF4644829.1 hypothetical protein TGRH88_006420 [Toxoplasma gondii]KFG32707.1 hypothetical protein TGDOM2_320760 [Toxoplasma gondii GAB2-2007-GAL-DOM2]KFG43258.1 hypothetical protein TGFOU_320760 [Toxoplasma gondii FOU]KFG44023.1 hypothetical protein TGP89_320760 [Toxoplasma gondii p89]KFH03820.1 |eukprot:XP_018638083.1 hypothetical protein TGME49_320760 [Toxoplasma gondii ME49]